MYCDEFDSTAWFTECKIEVDTPKQERSSGRVLLTFDESVFAGLMPIDIEARFEQDTVVVYGLSEGFVRVECDRCNVWNHSQTSDLIDVDMSCSSIESF